MVHGTRPADHRIECSWGDCRSTPPQGLGVCREHAIEAYVWVLEERAAAIARIQAENPGLPGDPKQGLVYAMRFGNLVKIGYTTNLAARRLAIPHDEVIGLAPGTMRNERQVHAVLADYRYKGEWFHLTPEVARWISEHMPLTP